MARIKGKWVGQVVIDFDWDETKMKNPFCFIDGSLPFEEVKKYVKEGGVTGVVHFNINEEYGDFSTVTVTQLHADLYRDEPSEWTKEEATP